LLLQPTSETASSKQNRIVCAFFMDFVLTV